MSVEIPSFRVRSWADIVALLTIFGMGAAGIVWGLKLDNRTDALARDEARVQALLDAGILPRTEERLKSIERRIDADERDIDRLQRDHENDGGSKR